MNCVTSLQYIAAPSHGFHTGQPTFFAPAMGSSPSCCERSGPLEAPAEIVAPTAAEKEPGPDAQETLDGESAWSSDLELQCDHLKVGMTLCQGSLKNAFCPLETWLFPPK